MSTYRKSGPNRQIPCRLRYRSSGSRHRNRVGVWDAISSCSGENPKNLIFRPNDLENQHRWSRCSAALDASDEECRETGTAYVEPRSHCLDPTTPEIQ